MFLRIGELGEGVHVGVGGGIGADIGYGAGVGVRAVIGVGLRDRVGAGGGNVVGIAGGRFGGPGGYGAMYINPTHAQQGDLGKLLCDLRLQIFHFLDPM